LNLGSQQRRLLEFEDHRAAIGGDPCTLDDAWQLRSKPCEIGLDRPGECNDQAVLDALGGIADRRRPDEADPAAAADDFAGQGDGVSPGRRQRGHRQAGDDRQRGEQRKAPHRPVP